MQIPFIGQAYESDSAFVSAQRCVNWYLEKSPEGGRTPAALFPTPGMSEWLTLGGECQALRLVNGRLFAVAGGALVEIDPATKAITSRGAVVNSGYAKLLDNGLQVLVLTGISAYCLTLETNALELIANAYLSAATQASVIDGYAVFAETGSQRVRITSAYDFKTVDDLDFASAEGLPDNLVTIVSLNREAWLFGERTTEIWFDSGNANFPFEKNSNTYLEFGCAARDSVGKLDGSLYWIGRASDGRVSCYRASGYQPEIIAHHGIAKWLEASDKSGGIAHAWAYTYHERGHPFYVLTLPDVGKTFAYDPLTSTWHERSFLAGTEKHHPAKNAVLVGGRVIVSVQNTHVLAEMSEAIFTDLGGPIVRTRVCPVLQADQGRMIVSNFELLLQSGNGAITGQGVTPVVKMRQSRDGGQSFGDWRTETAGEIGRTDRRVSFRRMGEAINRVIEVQVSDPVKWVILGATIAAKVAGRG